MHLLSLQILHSKSMLALMKIYLFYLIAIHQIFKEKYQFFLKFSSYLYFL